MDWQDDGILLTTRPHGESCASPLGSARDESRRVATATP